MFTNNVIGGAGGADKELSIDLISDAATFFVFALFGGFRVSLASIQREAPRENPRGLTNLCTRNPSLSRELCKLSLPQAIRKYAQQISPRTFSGPLAGFAAPPAGRAPRTWLAKVPQAESRKHQIELLSCHFIHAHIEMKV